ncbi:hypothetical protein [Mameliella alba]|uniref:hypothetical protein n=1 Tax=Mameliella alba TaxID=561184 RepID=UPI001556A9FA|nr:hypothetical protein [Mameliella alba]
MPRHAGHSGNWLENPFHPDFSARVDSNSRPERPKMLGEAAKAALANHALSGDQKMEIDLQGAVIIGVLDLSFRGES